MIIRIAILGAVVVGFASMIAVDAFGQTSAQASGNWSAPATWTNGEPDSTVTTNPTMIDGGFTVTIDSSGEVADLVDVGSATGQTGNLNITGGDLILSDSGPDPSFSPALRMGHAAGSTGNLTVSGGVVFIDSNADGVEEAADGDLIVGDNGTGTMTMTGGLVDADDEIFVGYGAGSNGSLNVSGGTLSTLGRNLLVGFGGANPDEGLSGAHGELNLSDTGTINVATFLFSSFNTGSTSTITQTGGTLSAGGDIVLARNGDSTYNHSGGAITANVFVLADNFPVAFLPGDFYTPHTPGAVGTYNISGDATFTVNAITWLGAFGGGHGIVNQTGGTFTTGGIAVGRDGKGTWNISAGALNQTGTDGYYPNNHLVVGQVGNPDGRLEGEGIVNQTGGTVTVATSVFLGDFDNTEGVYKISGGTLNVTGSASPDPGEFQLSDGNFNVGAALASNAAAARVDPTGPDDAQGQALAAKGTFIVSGSAATINIAGNFLANPADKHANRKNTPSDMNRDNSATLGFEIFDGSGTSLISVAGVADLDGAVIDLDLMEGFIPTVGTTFDLLRAASFGSTGTGTTQNVGTGEGFTLAPEDVGTFSLAVVAGGGFETLQATFLAAPAGVPGDYNKDGVVNAADYTVWRDHLGQTFQLDNEGEGQTPGEVTVEDYAFWKSRFGATSGSGAHLSTVVPEPTAWLLLAVGVVIGFGRPRRTD